MKPTSKKFRGLVAATLGLTVSLTLPVVFSGNVLLAQGVPTQNVAFRDPFQGSAPVTAPQTPPSVVSPQVRQEADQKLHAARKAIIVKDIATAERLVNEVAALQLTYQEREDSPARVQGVIQEFKRLAQMRQTQGGGNEMFRRDYAKFCLIHADTMLLRGELDLAAGLTQEAVDQRVQFNQADREKGLEPNAMFLKIADARRIQGMNNASAVAVQAPVQSLSHASQMQLGQAVQMLDQARQALNGGQIEQAEHLARRADAFSLPEAAYPPGNSPNRLLNEIAARRQGVSIPVNPPVNPQMAQMNQPSDAHSAFLRSSQDQSHIVQTSASNQTLAPPVPVLSRNTPYIDETLQQQRMIQGQFQSMVIQELANAHRMVQEQRRPDIALETLYNLKRRVDQSQQLDSATRQMYAVQIDRAIEETISFQRRYAAQARQDQHNEAVLAGLRHDAEMFQQKEQQLQQMFIEHKKLLDEQRYEEALRIAKQAYDIAPDEPAVAAMLTLTTFAFNISRSQSIEGQKREGFIESLLAVDRASRVPNFGRDGDMIFPDNWAELVKIRTASNQALIQQRPDTEKRIIRQLETPVVLNANQPLTLEQALNLLCGQVDIIPHIDRTAFQQEDIQTGSMVFMPPANGITARSVLSALLDQYGLTYVVKNEMLTITTKRRAQGSKIVRMHYVGDIALEIPIPRESSPVDDAIYRSWMLMSRDPSPMATMMLQQAPHVSPAANMMMMQSPNVSPIPPGPMRQPQQPGIPAFNDNFSYNGNGRAPNAMYPNAAGDPNVLAQYLSQYGGGYGGGMGGGYGGGMMGGGGYGGGMMGGGGYGGGMMGGGGYGGGMMGGMMGGMGGMGMNFGSIMGIITSVIEPESWQDGDAFMDMHYATQSLAIRQTEEVHAQIEDLLNQIRKMNDLQIAVEVRYITLSDSFFERMGTSFDMVFRNDRAFGRISQTQRSFMDSAGNQVDATITKGNNVVVGLRAPGEFSVDASIPLYQDSFGLAIPTFGGYNPAAGISTGFALLSDIETYFFISAAQGDTRSSVMEAPKVMLQNGQMGRLEDTTSVPFVTNVIPVVADFSAAYQPVITTLNQGQVLRVQATASQDRQHVRLTLNPTFTTIVRVHTFRFFGNDEESEETSVTRGDDSSSIAADPRSTSRVTSSVRSGVTIQQPEVATFAVSTTVTCPDGGTVLLGGIKRLSEARNEYGTPILNKIPYLQRLFANTSIGRDTQSIMIMVTPRIIIQEEEEQFIMGHN